MEVGYQAPIKVPSSTTVVVAQLVKFVADLLVKLSIATGVVFILSIVPVTFTPLGQWQIGGMPLIHIASIIAMLAIYGALLSAAVAMPIISLCDKARYKLVRAVAVQQAIDDYAVGVIAEDEYVQSLYVSDFTYKVVCAQKNGSAVAFLVSALIAFVAHDFMMILIGNPWTDLVTLILLAAFALAIGKCLVLLLTRKYRTVDPDLFEEVDRMIAVSERM